MENLTPELINSQDEINNLCIELNNIVDEKDLKIFIIDNKERLSLIPTKKLNILCHVEGYKIYNNKSGVYCQKITENRYYNVNELNKEVAELRKIIENQQLAYNALIKVIQKIALINHIDLNTF
jgi:hypothetical protein